MSGIRVKERDQKDPAGRIVDIFPEVGIVRTFVFNNDGEISYLHFFKKIIKVLFKISQSKNKLVRERDFPVWAG